MNTMKFDLTKRLGMFKPMNATNGGPWCVRHGGDSTSGGNNFADYKAARIPYSRNHDSAMYQVYGGPYSHDINKIFPVFSADPEDPVSYDFTNTDESILVCKEAGTETFFRLGQTIEHQIKKHGAIPPADFQKWAVICEHIIRHYNEGWADGFHLNIQYWEIWNEPDMGDDTWAGTPEQFFDLFEIAAKHLKACFPHLKIGGPAFCWNPEWLEKFLPEMQKRNVPMDFFSWHKYCASADFMGEYGREMRNMMEKYGYGQAESICNEWNYVENFSEKFSHSMDVARSLKGASFVLATMTVAQKSPIDMLMYYDTRPSKMCGIFDTYHDTPLKGYYAMAWYGALYDAVAEVRCENEPEGIYTLCGIKEDGKTIATVTYYQPEEGAEAKDIRLDFGKPNAQYEIYLTDDTHDGELITVTDKLEFRLALYSILLVKEV